MNFEVDKSHSKSKLLEEIQRLIDRRRPHPHTTVDDLARALYLPEIEHHLFSLPQIIREKTELYKITRQS